MYSVHHSFCCIRQIQRKREKKRRSCNQAKSSVPSVLSRFSFESYLFFPKSQHRVFFLFPEQRRWTFFLFFIQTRLWTTFSSINKLFSNFTFPFGYLPFCWHSVYISRIRPQCFFFFLVGFARSFPCLSQIKLLLLFFFFTFLLTTTKNHNIISSWFFSLFRQLLTNILDLYFFFSFVCYSHFSFFFFLSLAFSSLFTFFFLFRCLFRCPLLFPLLFFFSFSVNVVTVTREKKKKLASLLW